ncbi:DUF2325 domain-containing protein [Nitrosomonas sp. Is35]|uniref:DUF2325 domain-containing protein n=1 Tax=Nitrosomonas sp. Is35 TaxID=3080534 RepID=UPI00294B592F|nr:DUF2325 domain-containing protein [Nitrosomonas sp. Is35]MDV6348474.1 DUF2325 domain-containing protein [Nitrosomonas sp. Is35]
MKFLKKLALANTTGTIPHNHFTVSKPTDTFLSCCLRSLTQLSRAWKQSLDHASSKITSSRRRSDKSTPVANWAPLVKARYSTEANKKYNQTSHQNNSGCRLAGRSVLCVGGRIKLYPEYNRLVKNCDGCFMGFHGGSHDYLEDLPQLLKQADMIICPVDCVNHEAFFTVKHYCKYSGKPCVLLAHSEVNTFEAGIGVLVAMATSG